MSTMQKKIDFKYRKLHGAICEKYCTQREFADALGQTRATVSNYLTGRTMFNQKSMTQWANLLGIKREDYPDYFFK